MTAFERYVTDNKGKLDKSKLLDFIINGKKQSGFLWTSYEKINLFDNSKFQYIVSQSCLPEVLHAIGSNFEKIIAREKITTVHNQETFCRFLITKDSEKQSTFDVLLDIRNIDQLIKIFKGQAFSKRVYNNIIDHAFSVPGDFATLLAYVSDKDVFVDIFNKFVNLQTKNDYHTSYPLLFIDRAQKLNEFNVVKQLLGLYWNVYKKEIDDVFPSLKNVADLLDAVLNIKNNDLNLWKALIIGADKVSTIDEIKDFVLTKCVNALMADNYAEDYREINLSDIIDMSDNTVQQRLVLRITAINTQEVQNTNVDTKALSTKSIQREMSMKILDEQNDNNPEALAVKQMASKVLSYIFKSDNLIQCLKKKYGKSYEDYADLHKQYKKNIDALDYQEKLHPFFLPALFGIIHDKGIKVLDTILKKYDVHLDAHTFLTQYISNLQANEVSAGLTFKLPSHKAHEYHDVSLYDLFLKVGVSTQVLCDSSEYINIFYDRCVELGVFNVSVNSVLSSAMKYSAHKVVKHILDKLHSVNALDWHAVIGYALKYADQVALEEYLNGDNVVITDTYAKGSSNPNISDVKYTLMNKVLYHIYALIKPKDHSKQNIPIDEYNRRLDVAVDFLKKMLDRDKFYYDLDEKSNVAQKTKALVAEIDDFSKNNNELQDVIKTIKSKVSYQDWYDYDHDGRSTVGSVSIYSVTTYNSDHDDDNMDLIGNI